MAGVELTRFDFHVVRFMNSYDVELMTDAEVGQYILLLCKSWLMAKDCCLPDDPAFLARAAHTQEVSARVLAKFPLIETPGGTMRRNQTLFEQWEEVQARSEAGRASVAGRGGKWAETVGKKRAMLLVPGGTNTTVNTNEDTNVHVPVIPNPTQSVPIQSEPTQPEESGAPSVGDWSELRKRHRAVFGNKPDKSFFLRKYVEACQCYGEQVVLACFSDWAATAVDWAKREGIKQPLHAFFKKLPNLAEDERESQEEDKQEAAQRQREAEVARAEQAVVEQNVQRQKDEHTQRWTKETPPENGESVLDYLAEVERQEQN